MTNAMEVLFAYAQERMEKPLLLSEHEYSNARLCAEKQEERLRAMLGGEAAQLLDDLLQEQALLLFFCKQAAFRAGFQIALELSR